MVAPKIDVPREGLAELCRRHRTRRVALFGSVLRDDFGPGSDVDMVVEFEPGYSPGWDIIHVEEDFSRLVEGRKIDMVNPKYLNRRIRDRILSRAVTQYESEDAERDHTVCGTKIPGVLGPLELLVPPEEQ